MNKTGKTVLGVISAIFAALAVAMLVAAVALGWLYGARRDADGFVTGSTVSLSSDGYAVASADIDLASIPDGWIPSDLMGTLRVQAESKADSDVFIGVGPLDDVQAYLDDVEHSEVVRFGPWSDVSYVAHPGSSTPESPASQEFWTDTTEGSGPLSLDWEPQHGAWKLVIMNSDAGAGVDLLTSVAFNTPWLAVGVVVTGFGGLFSGALAVVLAVVALRRPSAPAIEESKEPELEPVGG